MGPFFFSTHLHGWYHSLMKRSLAALFTLLAFMLLVWGCDPTSLPVAESPTPTQIVASINTPLPATSTLVPSTPTPLPHSAPRQSLPRSQKSLQLSLPLKRLSQRRQWMGNRQHQLKLRHPRLKARRLVRGQRKHQRIRTKRQ